MARLDKRTEKRKLGDLGENIACEYLRRRGFAIIERNYLKKWGEIDIVAKNNNILRFIEVKSISCATSNFVPHGTPRQARARQDNYRPEENVHPWKLKRLSRAIQTYLLDRRVDNDWQLDIVTVRIDRSSRKARVEMIENVVF